MDHSQLSFLAAGQYPFKSRYDNFIGGRWVPPVGGEYFENLSPITGRPFCEVASSREADIDLALDAAHAAKDNWGRVSAAARSNLLNKIADRIEANQQRLAIAERDTGCGLAPGD